MTISSSVVKSTATDKTHFTYVTGKSLFYLPMSPLRLQPIYRSSMWHGGDCNATLPLYWAAALRLQSISACSKWCGNNPDPFLAVYGKFPLSSPHRCCFFVTLAVSSKVNFGYLSSGKKSFFCITNTFLGDSKELVDLRLIQAPILYSDIVKKPFKN